MLEPTQFAHNVNKYVDIKGLVAQCHVFFLKVLAVLDARELIERRKIPSKV